MVMKKEIEKWLKTLYPNCECRYSGRENTMYVHNTGVKAIPESEYSKGQLGNKKIKFAIVVQ